MVKIIEIKGDPCVFTLTDGSTLRIYPYASKTIKESLVSDEVKRAGELGYVRITALPRVKAENKTGGTK